MLIHKELSQDLPFSNGRLKNSYWWVRWQFKNRVLRSGSELVLTETHFMPGNHVVVEEGIGSRVELLRWLSPNSS